MISRRAFLLGTAASVTVAGIPATPAEVVDEFAGHKEWLADYLPQRGKLYRWWPGLDTPSDLTDNTKASPGFAGEEKTSKARKEHRMAKAFTKESILADLKATGECNIPGVGKIKAVQREARTGRNPFTGEPLQIPAKKAVTFSASKALKDALNT